MKTKSLSKFYENKEPINVNNISEVQFKGKLQRKIEDIQNTMKQNLQTVLAQLEQEENEDNAILQNVMMS